MEEKHVDKGIRVLKKLLGKKRSGPRSSALGPQTSVSV
jgi:hypothetical protein